MMDPAHSARLTPKQDITPARTLAMMRVMATPPDFDDLIARGLLKQAGQGWYALLVPADALPQPAQHHVIAMRSTKTGPQLKFQSVASIARFARDMQRRGVLVR